MAIFRPSFTTPIPNNPFYSPQTDALSSVAGQLIVGSGITIDYTTGTISTSGGGGGGSGTVTTVNTGAGLTGGPITSSGTISLTATGVTPGTYTNVTFAVDANGRLTSASSGTPPVSSVTGLGPITVTGTTARVVSIAAASTSAAGAVQLYNGTDSTSTTLALTAAQGFSLQSQIDGLSFASNLTLAGTFNAATGFMLSVTADGTSQGFAVGSVLPTPVPGNQDYFVIVTVGGTFDPLGPTGPITATAGDWVLSTGTQWDLLDIGPTSLYATTTVAGSVCLSTDALAQAGTDTLTALTPATARSAFVPNVCYPAQGSLIGGSSVANTPVTVAIGTAGQVLTVDSTAPTGFAWKTPASSGTVTSVATGTGLSGGPVTTTGTIALTDTAVTPGIYTNATINVDQQGRLTAASSGTLTPTIPCACITGKGALITGTAASAVVALPVGTPGQTLVVDLTCASGLTWATPAPTGVTSVATGTGLTGGPITSTGTIALANTAVTPGPYTNASFTVDQQGRLTSAASGIAPLTALTGTAPIAVTAGTTPVVSIGPSSTTALGAVQLTNALNNTSETLALTACAGKSLQDQITGLTNAGTIELAGTIDASTGFLLTVTSVGTADGYTVGAVLPAASATTNNTYVIVTTPGTLTPPGGSATVATRGDWFLVSETSPGVYAWTFLNVGFDAPTATTTTAGIVCLSTDALAQAGTDTTTALTPAAATSAFIPNTCITAKGALITGSAANTPVPLAVGTNGQLLVACSTAATGLCWITATLGPATPTTFGTVVGCTSNNTALGCFALENVSTGDSNVAIGNNSMRFYSTGVNNTAIGAGSALGDSNGSGNVAVGASAFRCGKDASRNVAVGENALVAATGGEYNVALGWSALCGATGTGGGSNVALGALAGNNITTGSSNVVIGPNVTVPFGNQNSQLAIGYNAGQCWITGDSSKNVKFWAGIRDNSDSLGTACQVLTSTGTGVTWGPANTQPWVYVGAMVFGTPLALTTAFGGFVLTNASYNGVWKQQVGPKTWNVIYQLRANGTQNAQNPGDFVFTLPPGLSFDTGTLSFQNNWSGNVNTSSHANRQYFLPGGFTMEFNAGSGTGSQFGAGVATWSGNQFRFFITDGGNGAPRAWGSNYWNNSDTSINIGFQFQTP